MYFGGFWLGFNNWKVTPRSKDFTITESKFRFLEIKLEDQETKFLIFLRIMQNVVFILFWSSNILAKVLWCSSTWTILSNYIWANGRTTSAFAFEINLNLLIFLAFPEIQNKTLETQNSHLCSSSRSSSLSFNCTSSMSDVNITHNFKSAFHSRLWAYIINT